MKEDSTYPEIEWSDQNKCWLVFSGKLIRSLMLDSQCRVVDYRSELQHIGDHIGYGYSGSIFALSHVPLALEGSEHEEANRRIRDRIKAVSQDALKSFSDSIDNNLRVFHSDNEIDLSEHFFSPISNSLIESLSGIPRISVENGLSVSQVFDRFLGLNRRKTINEALARFQSNIASEPNLGVPVALQILGGDAILGSFQETFLDHVLRNKWRMLSEIKWQDSLTATGVPYVERVLEKDCTISGSLLKGGDRIRLVLGAYQKAGVSDERNESKLYFGIGRHTCLGKMLSVKAWKVLVGKLQTINRSVEISSISYRISDSVFSCPISFRVRCHDGSR